jgi:starch phosphorylase
MSGLGWNREYMSQTIKEIQDQEVTIQGRLPEPLSALERISWNYWWSWAPDGNSVFRDLDPELWEQCEHNP